MRGYIVYDETICEAELRMIDDNQAYVEQCAARFFRGKTIPPSPRTGRCNWLPSSSRPSARGWRDTWQRPTTRSRLEDTIDLIGKARNCDLHVRWME